MDSILCFEPGAFLYFPFFPVPVFSLYAAAEMEYTGTKQEHYQLMTNEKSLL